MKRFLTLTSGVRVPVPEDNMRAFRLELDPRKDIVLPLPLESAELEGLFNTPALPNGARIVLRRVAKG